jgi:ATP-binding cassette, subfamily B, bacterial
VSEANPEPSRRAARSAVVLTLRLLPALSRRLSAAALGLLALSAVLPVGFAVASGLLIGSLPDAVGAGLGSPAGHRLLLAIGAVALLFLLQQLSAPTLRTIADALGRRLDGSIRRRLMALTQRPPGVAHLEDAAVLDQLKLAQTVGTGQFTPRDAVVGMASVGAVRGRRLASTLLLAAFSWWLAIAVLLVSVATTSLMRRNFKRGVAALRGNPGRFRRSDYFRDLAVTPAAAKDVRIFALAGWLKERFDRHWREAMADLWRQRRSGRWVPLIAPVGVLVTLGGAFAVLAHSAAVGTISVGQLTAFAGAVLGIASIRGFGIDDLQILYGSAAVPAVADLERLLAARTSVLPGDGKVEGLPRRRVRFEHVSFRYPGQTEEVLRDLELDIAVGRSLAIVGSNGAGKTTVAKLLARFYDPTRGRVLVDGYDLAGIDPRWWQRRVAAVFQDFTRYELSGRENVGFGAVERLEDQAGLCAAAEAAGARGLIEGLPAGWDTVLSPALRGGVDLSGGEWQRLALARALFAVRAGARILILDEPTAALDIRAEAALYERLLEPTKGLTTIVISHRFATVRRADRIVVLERGRVIEHGDHATLLRAGGRYAWMFRLQASHFEDAPVGGVS